MTLDPNTAINFLNDCIARDRHAMQELLSIRIPCNDAIAQHPTLPVEMGSMASLYARPGEFRMGVLSVLVGMCGEPQLYRGFPIPPFKPLYENGILIRVEPSNVAEAQRQIDEYHTRVVDPAQAHLDARLGE